MTEEEKMRLSIIHGVLSAGNDILKAQKLLMEATLTLVNYASKDFGVAYRNHSEIVDSLYKNIKDLNSIVETDTILFDIDNLILSDN